MTKINKRIFILNEAEINDIYEFPQFTEVERIHYFALSPSENAVVKELIYIHSKVHFILQLGYFKAKQRLFKFTFLSVVLDVEYVMQRYFQSQESPETEPSRNIRGENNKRVLFLAQYSNSLKETQQLLFNKAQSLTRYLSKPIVLLRELIIYLEQKRIVIPEYTTLQDIIGKAISAEEKRLQALIVNSVPPWVNALLEKLFSANDISYEIAALKQDPKNFNFNQIQREIYKHKTYYPLYEFSKEFLLTLDISRQNVEYYASLITHYHKDGLSKLPQAKSNLYLLCYANHRFQKMNDHLMQSFLHYVDLYSQEAKQYAEKMAAEIYSEMYQYLKSAGQLLSMYTDGSLSELPFKKVQKKAIGILPKNKIILVSNYMNTQCIDKESHAWEYHAKHFQSILKNIRPVFMVLNFNTNENDMFLLEGVNFLKSAYLNNKSISEYKEGEVPIQFIPNRQRQYIYGTKIVKSIKGNREVKCINPYKYEFMVYSQLRKHISSNVIFYNDTLQYKSFEADIGVVKNWKKDKSNILKTLDCQKLISPIEGTISKLEEELEFLIQDVNERIENKENSHIKIKEKKGSVTWTLPYKKKNTDFNNPFYDQMQQINVTDLINMVDKHCDFMKSFTHIKPYGASHRENHHCIKACLIANATGLGVYKMADNSNLSYNSLSGTQKNYIRLETLRDANNKVIKKMADLPIFKHYNRAENIFHASMDGQKYQTKHETFKSRYSTKYFGLEKGVVSLTMVLNHVPVNTKIIGANEYEGHYLFDMLFNNSSCLEPNRVSTDTHGSNNLNFVLLNLLDIEFAPCYKSISKKSKQLCGFKNLSDYKDLLIFPSHKVNKKLIIDEWPNMQPILAALMMKETTQSVVVKKLCSYQSKNKTKEALWEYNNILMSINLLKYIDDVALRQFVRFALNRGEAYHLLHASISGASGKRFRGSSDSEIEIWNECARLFANVMLFYNAYILSQLMLKKEKEGNYGAAEFIRKLSPAASQHFNLNGRYEFGLESESINVEEIIEHLDKILGQNQNIVKSNVG